MSKYFIFILLFITNIHFSISSYIRICNQAGYLAKCYLESRGINYGFQTLKHNTGLFPVLQCETLDIPYDADWNRVECKALIFIAVYKSIFKQEFPLGLFNFCYTITGTILNPTWSQTPC